MERPHFDGTLDCVNPDAARDDSQLTHLGEQGKQGSAACVSARAWVRKSTRAGAYAVPPAAATARSPCAHC